MQRAHFNFVNHARMAVRSGSQTVQTPHLHQQPKPSIPRVLPQQPKPSLMRGNAAKLDDDRSCMSLYVEAIVDLDEELHAQTIK